jgi:phosphatidylinositol glycan class W
MASYKQRKEDFVSNLTGGSVSEISFVTAVAPVSLAFCPVVIGSQTKY